MKKQSEREWLAKELDRLHVLWLMEPHAEGVFWNTFTAIKLLTALKRRGWTPPKKGKGKK